MNEFWQIFFHLKKEEIIEFCNSFSWIGLISFIVIAILIAIGLEFINDRYDAIISIVLISISLVGISYIIYCNVKIAKHKFLTMDRTKKRQ